MPEPDLQRTGIKGLDEVLFGGVPRGNIILVTGTAGTGKTTLGVELCVSRGTPGVARRPAGQFGVVSPTAGDDASD